MPGSDIKAVIDGAVKDAMRSRDKQRLGALRLIMAEFKRVEVDERIELDDDRVMVILGKMNKQRKDSLAQFLKADRTDLADQEQFELDLISEFLPEPLDQSALQSIVDAAIKSAGATSMKDMGTVMSLVRDEIKGRADMGAVSALVKSSLA